MLLPITPYLLGAVIGFFIACSWVAFALRKIRIAKEYERESLAAMKPQEVESIATPVAHEEPQETTAPQRRVPFLSLITRSDIMSNNEIEFYQRLTMALPEYYILAQVSFAALIAPIQRLQGDERLRVFRTFSQNRADYVVCYKDTMRVVAVVELDDATHDAEKDKKRDGMLRAGGYEVIRYQSAQKPSADEIAAKFKRYHRS